MCFLIIWHAWSVVYVGVICVLGTTVGKVCFFFVFRNYGPFKKTHKKQEILGFSMGNVFEGAPRQIPGQQRLWPD